MKSRTRILIILLALTTTLVSDRVFLSAEQRPDMAQPERLRFHVTAIEESGGRSDIVSDATVEGPPGTDFDINLQGERFKMSARFLTDLITRDSLKVRAKLNTRRLYGYSERNLPLYEEDSQTQTLELGFDEAVVLLPFGRNGGDSRLKIEITPEVSPQGARLPSGKERPLEIKIQKQSPGGAISIQASKKPHRFTVEAALIEDGREVARGSNAFLIEEAGELRLKPTEGAGPEVVSNPLTVNLTVNQYTRSSPAGEATIGFDLYGADRQAGQAQERALKWAGAGPLGSDMTYNLSDVYLKGSGKKYELRFRINLAQGERAD